MSKDIINLKTIIVLLFLSIISLFSYQGPFILLAKQFTNIDNTLQKITLENILDNKENLTKYSGDIEFLTFNTLMAFPEKALSKNNQLSNTYDEKKLTTNEFKTILKELYKNNYILLDIYDLIDTSSSNIIKKDLYIPKDKKPIVLTFDNVTYVSNYQNLGEIDKIIIDRNHELATYTTKKAIQDRVQYDNESIVILENFIKVNPDFSYNDSRGIIFFSGENGILGYNVNHKSASNKYEAKRASEVVMKLKSKGWKFGSNNYCYKIDNTKSDMEFAKEISLWDQDIKSIVGSTDLYAYPYGIYNVNDTTKQELLLTNGYKIFFENNFKNNFKISGNMCKISRKEVNGKSLRENSPEFSHLFNCEKVYDHANRLIPFIK